MYDEAVFSFDFDDKKEDNQNLIQDIEMEEKIELKPIKSKFDCQDLFHQTTHADVLCRMLYVYAKLNPSISYTSGMNEIIANLYYTFYNDALTEQKQFAEADTFFCFNALMTELQGFFAPQLTKGENGIITKLQEFDNLLLVLDPELALHLKNNNLEAIVYAHRWFVLLLSREFDFIFVLKIWDILLTHSDKMKFLTALCLAIVISKREYILAHLIDEIISQLRKNNHKLENIFKLALEIYDKLQD